MTERSSAPRTRDSATSPHVMRGLALQKMGHLLAGTATEANGGWKGAWPDALAFAAGLALAWYGEWQTKDLVWSLWLSSLVVGYAMIVWTIFGRVGLTMWQARAMVSTQPAVSAAGAGVLLGGGLFLLAFFTVHFGMFHFVHSVFLNGFFPVSGERGFPGASVYFEVVRNYGVFVLVAAVAERHAFKRPELITKTDPKDIAVTAEAIRRRKQRNGELSGGMMAPYKNVIRLHLLIFFFAGASFLKLDNFLVYAVVYAVYFFPWRLLARPVAASGDR